MTKSLYVVSTAPHAGKSAICLALALALRDEGIAVGYMKPLGASLMRRDDGYVDEDAYVAWNALGITEPWEYASPVLLTDDVRSAPLAGPVEGLATKITQALARLSEGRDVVIMEGLGRTFDGQALGLSAPEVADLTGAAVLAVIGYRPDLDLDSILFARQVFGDRLIGIVIDGAPPRLVETATAKLASFLARHNLACCGVVASDPVLRSITVRELAEELGGEVLCAEDQLDELVETYMLGAMTGDAAYLFFQRKANKAVITGGDRSDVIMAALRTSTRCLILTGNLRPEVQVLSAAAEQGVPVILVTDDTLTTTERVERAISHVRLSSPKQIARLRETRPEYQRVLQMVKEELDL
ncbi:phosphotransacetylase family protein [Candidatus Fermentibacteria bacterium]|nr:phosphotransacetylase family protein [Candidatus Fermentibacteria bacterium]